MKVLFLKDVARVAQRGQIKEMADGYALNSLIPKGFAVQATPEKIAKAEAEAKEHAADESRREAEYAGLLSKIGPSVSISAKANERDQLYKKLSESEVSRALQKEFGAAIPESALSFDAPIKSIGEFALRIKIGKSEKTVNLKLEKGSA